MEIGKKKIKVATKCHLNIYMNYMLAIYAMPILDTNMILLCA